MARFRFLALLASFSLLFACGEKDDPGGNGGGGKKELPPKILSFEVTPSVLPVGGGTVTLTWKTEDAVSGKLSANGETIIESVWPLSQGDIEWEIAEPTTFELVVVNDDGEAREEARVEFGEDVPAIVSFTATPSEILRGEGTLLRWKTENAESVEVRDGAGTALNLHGASPDDGAVGVRPKVNTTYTLIATKGEAQVEAQVEVTVLPVELRIVSFQQVDPRPRLPGDAVELSWEVEGADALHITNLEGEEISIGEDKLARGSATLTMGEGGRFRLVAFQDDESIEEDLVVPLLTPPTIGEFVAFPAWVSAPSGSTELRWSGVERAERLILERDPGEAEDVTSLGLESGSFVVEVDTETTFTLVAANAAGEARAEVSVGVVPLPTILSFTATPARVGAGEAFTLSWETVDGHHLTLESEFGSLDVEDGALNAQFAHAGILEDTEFVLRLYNRADDFVEARLTVTVGPPEVLSASFSPPFVGPGQHTQLEWEVLGGTVLRVKDENGDVICQTADAAEIAQGSCPITGPSEGSYEYVLEVENGVGEITQAVVPLLTGAGPYILAFTVDPAQVEEGGSVEFSWLVVDDPLGAPMTVTISEGTKNYDVPEGERNEGSQIFVLEEVGTHTFTLTASSANGARSSSVDVEVFGLPAVSLTSSATVYEGEDPITLSWTSEHATGGLVLYEVGDGGQLVEIYEVPEGERASGSYDLEPTDDTTYRLVATNGLGSTAHDEVSVTIGPPVILSFTADPIEVIAGDEVELSWTTRLADGVELDLPIFEEFTVSEVNNPYVDISSTGTKLTLTQDCGQAIDANDNIVWLDPEDEGCATIAFPPGFEFPFGGDLHSAIRVIANGSLSFDFTYPWITFRNYDFPIILWGIDIPIHIAPFWDDIAAAEVWYQFDSDAEGEFLVVQWTGPVYDFPGSNIEVQAVLRDSGKFTFRYGNMTGQGDLMSEEHVNGASATIGFQTPAYDVWHNLHFGHWEFWWGDPMPGGLGGRAWTYMPPLPPPGPNGSVSFAPSESQTVTLTAHGKNGDVSATVSIIVHEAPELVVVEPAEEPQAGWPFELGWETDHVDAVEVRDSSGTVLCTAAPEEVEEGACLITEATPGTYTYTVRAVGALSSTAEEVVTIEVFPTFVLESFEASVEAVEPNAPVTLTWLTHGAAAMELTANGVDILPPSASPDAGSTVHTPTEHTTYELTIHSADGRSRVAQVVVEVKTVDLTVGLTPGTIQLGEPTTLSWNASALVGGTPSVYLPMTETSSSFEDISNDPNAVLLQGDDEDDTFTTHTFAGGFSFPFGGQLQTEIAVSTNGFLTFDLSATDRTFTNQALPTASNPQVHLAPFWDDLHTRASGRIHALARTDGSYVIQWTNVSKIAESSISNEWDLNFQVVLYSDGAFEYRYGTMDPLAITSTSCADGDCYNDAQGASATIGYQNPTTSVAFQLHFGGSTQSSSNTPYPGGLAHRSFRKEGGTSGSLTLYPFESTSIEVCTELLDYLVCEEAEVEVQ